ncbi:hypothetical protein I7I51_03066 [Histoplasma capsulatum]|uniref:Uncharacterized protein n=1 Tax=Ajellomyces capsulatus TaxID=5037 RepID=A0A8A1MQ11_AJECA|nr:hypothetical protein I7I51_03066 [Histoplasma capsulatum]
MPGKPASRTTTEKREPKKSKVEPVAWGKVAIRSVQIEAGYISSAIYRPGFVSRLSLALKRKEKVQTKANLQLLPPQLLHTSTRIGGNGVHVPHIPVKLPTYPPTLTLRALTPAALLRKTRL